MPTPANELRVGDVLLPGEETVFRIEPGDPGYLEVTVVKRGNRRPGNGDCWRLAYSHPIHVARPRQAGGANSGE